MTHWAFPTPNRRSSHSIFAFPSVHPLFPFNFSHTTSSRLALELEEDSDRPLISMDGDASRQHDNEAPQQEDGEPFRVHRLDHVPSYEEFLVRDDHPVEEGWRITSKYSLARRYS